MTFPAGVARAHNVEAIGYLPLQDKPAFKMAIHKAGDRWYWYCAHLWESGWSVVEVTDPRKPRFVRFIQGPPNTWTLQIQIADGRMITSMERIPPNWGGDDAATARGEYGEGFSIWSLEDPENPRPLGHYKTGGDGTHRNFYAGGRYVFATALPKGYQGHILQIVDISDPANPKEISRWWRKGQWTGGGESGATKDVLLHGGAYVKGDRAYLPYSAGGFVILDISDLTQPKLVSDLPFSPPFQSFIAVHSAVPLQRKPLVIVNSEAISERCDEPLGFVGIVDVSKEDRPRLISLFPLPVPPKELGLTSFCHRAGRFGPHNQHQPQYQPVLWQDERYLYVTYFNAGLRVYDVEDERAPREVGWFLPPDPQTRRGPLPKTGLVAQSEDVVVDARGNIFVSDKNHGVYILRHNG
ncbi:MAG TPA: hypothetical protein VNU64_05815 [Burkholderiales bacterium]|nr:hypothetical protein [Burkholderiales bacterium]